MEVRGLGIINIVDLFGVAATLEEKKLELVINLEKWNPKKKYDRLGEENLYFTILGNDIPMFNLPVATGEIFPPSLKWQSNTSSPGKTGADRSSNIFTGRTKNE